MTRVSRPTHTVTQARLTGTWAIESGRSYFPTAGLAAHLLAPAPEDARGPMLSYLWRRFGYPVYCWDATKSLVNYALSTPDDEVILVCDPQRALPHSFWYGLSVPLEEELIRVAQPLLAATRDYAAFLERFQPTPVFQRIADALAYTLEDLLRPVCVGNSALTLRGPIDLEALDARSYAAVRVAPSAATAGEGIGWGFDPTTAANQYLIAAPVYDEAEAAVWAAVAAADAAAGAGGDYAAALGEPPAGAAAADDLCLFDLAADGEDDWLVGAVA